MWRLTLSNTLAHRSRLALTWLAVALGVAFVAGSLVLTDTSSRVLDDQFRMGAAGVDLTVRTAAAFDSAMGVEVQRDPLPAALGDRVAAIPGVAKVRATAGGAAQLSAGGSVVAPNGPTLLGSWAGRPFTAYTLRSGHAPRAADEVVLDVATARQQRVALGDTVTVSATASRTLRVVGLAGVGDNDGLANTAVVLTDLATAQELLGLGARVSSVEVVAADGVAVPDLRARVAATLGSAYAVTSAQDAAAASADAAKQSVSFLRVVLLALAGAGLVVGAFLIANTFGIVLTQRSKELALLRAAGATGRQVFGSVVGEALLVGLTGAAGGTLLGVGAAYGLRGLVQGAGMALPDGPLAVTPPDPGRRRRGGHARDPAGRPRPGPPCRPRGAGGGDARLGPGTDRTAAGTDRRPAGPCSGSGSPRSSLVRWCGTCAGSAWAPPCCWPPWSCSGRSWPPGWPGPSAARWTPSGCPGSWPGSRPPQPAPDGGHRDGPGDRAWRWSASSACSAARSRRSPQVAPRPSPPTCWYRAAATRCSAGSPRRSRGAWPPCPRSGPCRRPASGTGSTGVRPAR